MRVAIIPARGGSKRIPLKNIRLFHGKPIIAYSIETAQNSGLFDGGIYCSTEDETIAGIAENFGAKWIRRPPELAEVNGAPDPGTQEVTRHAIAALMAEGKQIDIACCIYATAPLMTIHYLRRGCEILERNPKANFAYATYPQAGGKVGDAGQFYFGRTQAFLDRQPLDPYNEHVWKIMIPFSQVCDVNTEDDWLMAEDLYRKMTELA